MTGVFRLHRIRRLDQARPLRTYGHEMMETSKIATAMALLTLYLGSRVSKRLRVGVG